MSFMSQQAMWRLLIHLTPGQYSLLRITIYPSIFFWFTLLKACNLIQAFKWILEILLFNHSG